MCITSETCRADSVIKTAQNNLHQAGPNKTQIEMQTVNVVYFQRKIQLYGFSAYPDDSPSQLNRISGVLLFYIILLIHIVEL